VLADEAAAGDEQGVETGISHGTLYPLPSVLIVVGCCHYNRPGVGIVGAPSDDRASFKRRSCRIKLRGNPATQLLYNRRSV
jgi:hypothetical protein